MEIAASHGTADPKTMTRLIMTQKLPPPLTIPALVSVSGSGVATISSSHANSVVTLAPIQSSPTITPTSTLHVPSEPHSVHLNVQSPSVLHSPSPKSPSGAILVPSPGIGVTQYSMTIVNPTHATIAKMPNFVSVEPLASATSASLPSTTTSCSAGFLTTTLKNVVSTSKSSENAPANSPSTATVLTNFVWKVGNTDNISSPSGASVTHMSQERTPPAQLQYILPSFTLQTSPAGKGPSNVLSMAIPSGTVPSGGIQIAIPTGPVQTSNLHPLTPNGQMVQSQSQGSGKIQFGPVVTAKMVVPAQQTNNSTAFTPTSEGQQPSNSVIVSKPLGLSMVHTPHTIGPSIGIQQAPIQLTTGQAVALSPSTSVSHASPRLLVPSSRVTYISSPQSPAAAISPGAIITLKPRLTAPRSLESNSVTSSFSSVCSPKISTRSGSPGSTSTTAYQFPTKLSLNVPKSPSNASPQFYTGVLNLRPGMVTSLASPQAVSPVIMGTDGYVSLASPHGRPHKVKAAVVPVPTTVHDDGHVRRTVQNKENFTSRDSVPSTSLPPPLPPQPPQVPIASPSKSQIEGHSFVGSPIITSKSESCGSGTSSKSISFDEKVQSFSRSERIITKVDGSQSSLSGLMGEQHPSTTTQKVFILAPTPAQLGLTKRISSDSQCAKTSDNNNEDIEEETRSHASSSNDTAATVLPESSRSPSPSTKMPAPLTKDVPPSPRKPILKKPVEDGMDRVLEEVGFSKRFAQLPQFNPEECQSPSALSIHNSPRTFVQSYRKKRRISSVQEESDGDPLSAKQRHYSSSSETGTPKSPRSAKLEGNKFFGEDFSLDGLSDSGVMKIEGSDGEINSPRSPHTPKTPREGGEKVHSSLRRILDQRRQLVMQLFQEHGYFPSGQATSAFQARHSDIFPNKTCLQLKIREVRQKLMAQSNASCIISSPSTTTSCSVAGGSLSSTSQCTNVHSGGVSVVTSSAYNNGQVQGVVGVSSHHQPLTPPPSAQDVNPSQVKVESEGGSGGDDQSLHVK